MATRTDRIEARVETERAERIRYGSVLVGESMSSFVARAAVDRAERVIAEPHAWTNVDDDYFARLLTALDEPPRRVPALARSARQAAKEPMFHRR